MTASSRMRSGEVSARRSAMFIMADRDTVKETVMNLLQILTGSLSKGENSQLRYSTNQYSHF